MPLTLLVILAGLWFGLCAYATWRWGRLLVRRSRFYRATIGPRGSLSRVLSDDSELIKLRRKVATLFCFSALGLACWAVLVLSHLDAVWVEVAGIVVLYITPIVLARAGHLEDKHDRRIWPGA